MLKVKNLTVIVGENRVLTKINLEIKQGEVAVLFGPNGSGKSSLIRTIMGFDGYRVEEGEIIFKGIRLNHLPVEERVRLKIGIMYQHPPSIRGVKLYQIAKFLCEDTKKISELARTLSLAKHLYRDVNFGFSGGEIKRAELFQVILQGPDLLLLDEPESGVDIENVSIMGKVLDAYLERENKSALIITHTGYILDYVRAKKGYVMMKGKIWCEGEPKEIFESIKTYGYDKCKECKDEYGRRKVNWIYR